jgi:hypothetical protein
MPRQFYFLQEKSKLLKNSFAVKFQLDKLIFLYLCLFRPILSLVIILDKKIHTLFYLQGSSRLHLRLIMQRLVGPIQFQRSVVGYMVSNQVLIAMTNV